MVDADRLVFAGLLVAWLMALVWYSPSLGGAACGAVAFVLVRYWLSNRSAR